MKPLAIDLCCGLGGWSHGLISEGWDVIGYDIERHDYGNGAYPGKLVLQDIRTIDGRQFRGKVSLITASPPCTEYSYMAMPWSLAKQIRAALLGRGDFPKGYKGSRTIAKLNELFNACVRIGQEAGCPIIIENVRGAQCWVGKARWNFGSFYLWGDVPALMPIPMKRKHKTIGPVTSSQAEQFNCHINEMRDALKGEGNKTAGMNWSNRELKDQDFTRIAGQQAEATKVPSPNGRPTAIGNGVRFTSQDCGVEGTKQPGIGGIRDNGKGDAWFQNGAARRGSKSNARKQVSAEIAKIPPALATWIARTFKPQHENKVVAQFENRLAKV